MEIKKEHFLDKGEQDEQGFYDYYYEGDLYEISFDNITYYARCYTHTPDELSFHAREISGKDGRIFKRIPYKEATFIECVKHFRDNLGFRQFKLLTSSGKRYEPVDLKKFK